MALPFYLFPQEQIPDEEICYEHLEMALIHSSEDSSNKEATYALVLLFCSHHLSWSWSLGVCMCCLLAVGWESCWTDSWQLLAAPGHRNALGIYLQRSKCPWARSEGEYRQHIATTHLVLLLWLFSDILSGAYTVITTILRTLLWERNVQIILL